jgi:hypothetical protein
LPVLFLLLLLLLLAVRLVGLVLSFFLLVVLCMHRVD